MEGEKVNKVMGGEKVINVKRSMSIPSLLHKGEG